MQTFIVAAIVVLAAGYIVLCLLRRFGVVEGASGCGCGCDGCGPVKLSGSGSDENSKAKPLTLRKESPCCGCSSGRGCSAGNEGAAKGSLAEDSAKDNR